MCVSVEGCTEERMLHLKASVFSKRLVGRSPAESGCQRSEGVEKVWDICVACGRLSSWHGCYGCRQLLDPQWGFVRQVYQKDTQAFFCKRETEMKDRGI